MARIKKVWLLRDSSGHQHMQSTVDLDEAARIEQVDTDAVRITFHSGWWVEVYGERKAFFGYGKIPCKLPVIIMNPGSMPRRRHNKPEIEKWMEKEWRQ